MFEKYDCILSDFDGTISKYDVIHSFISTFGKGNWKEIEQSWCRGEITSKECFDIQFERLNGMDEKTFHDFINTVEIDLSFIEFYKIAHSENKEIILVSDGLDVFIESIFNRFNINIPIFSNKLNIKNVNGKLYFKIDYPHIKHDCEVGLGCCKCAASKLYGDNFLYIGDGLSDRCIAKKAQTLFAKKHLEDYCKRENIKYHHFDTFNDIMNVLVQG